MEPDRAHRLVPKGPDPRVSTAPRSEIPRLLREGAAEWSARRFWHAHESWETAWHALRALDEPEAAEYLHGMILTAAALENATRGKDTGFKRQFAEGLHLLLAHPEGSGTLGVREARAWESSLVKLYADACRRLDWATWNASGWSVPAPELP